MALALLASLPIAADEVLLKNGRVLEGVVVDDNDEQVVIELAAGKMTLPKSMVESIEITSSRVSEYQQRAQSLTADDVEGWLRLAFWAQDERLDTKAQAAFDKVLAADPANLVTREVLGLLGREDPAEPYRPDPTTLQGPDAPFQRPWTAAELVPRAGAVREAAAAALSLAEDCRWAEAAWRLREIHRNQGEALDSALAQALIVALDLTAHSTSPTLETLFTPEDTHFDRGSCTLSLRFEGAQPAAWELAELTAGDHETLDLSDGGRTELVMPFRRTGAQRHLGTSDRIEEEILLEVQWAGLAEGPAGGVALVWSTDEEPPSSARLKVSGETGGAAVAEISSTWSEEVASYRQRHELTAGFLDEDRYLRAKVADGPVTFDVDGAVTESMNLPRGEHLRLALEGLEGRAVLRSIAVSGAIDGLWLARRRVVAARDGL